MTTTTLTATSATRGTARLAWLDALRGVAVVAVLAEHLLQAVLPALRPYWFNMGIYGVLVFFLVSGYIIPASLERRGELPDFWISRIFRLYPLYLAIIGLVLATSWWIPVREAVPADPSAVAAHATMLIDVVGVAAVVDTMWTLSYEMVFYLVAAALFTVRAHRRSNEMAVAFAVAAVLAGLFLSGAPLGGGALAWVSCVVLAVGLACVVLNRLAVPASRVLGVGALLLLVLGSRAPWLGLALLAVMFTGTALQRWESGTGALWPVGVTATLVALAPAWAVQAGWWWVQPGVWITTLALAAATFAAGMALRRRRVPRALAWLGLVSYSIYLVHVPLLNVVNTYAWDLRFASPLVQVPAAIALTAAVLLAAWLAYRWIELPAQRLGHLVRTRRR
ncbi:acyltransferase family protein [Nonomuraea rhizosphaerae]|uniref:acyltransferase family protein n=1 Tax=Nonomuraea rhizosphaerae TaxID=2665663 RepID=UPI001C5D1805|nr:acyltransferase [Nonomuraea rhizosphaerae]